LLRACRLQKVRVALSLGRLHGEMHMSTAAIVIVGVLVLIVGGVLALRSSARTGMPSPDVLDRATRRARELNSDDKH
jgi:hypothetical protein